MESLGVNQEFWNGRKVLITGHTGFKGSWLAIWLQKMGAHVVGFALPPVTTPSLFESARVPGGMISITGDIRNLDEVRKVLIEHGPEVVFHMAAQSLVRYSYANPVETFSTNIMGTVNILESIRHAKSVRSAIIVTSDKCYGNQEKSTGYKECDPMGGYDPYSSSKGCAELVTTAYRNSYFSNLDSRTHTPVVASARAGNVIGGGDWALDRLVPDVVSACMENRTILVRRPDAIRPWQHVLEPLFGYLELAEKLHIHGQDYAEAWNFGPGDNGAKSVSWLVDRMVTLWGNGAHWKEDRQVHPHETSTLRLDCTKAQDRLGWLPRLSISDALEWTIAWYKAFRGDKNMRPFTEQQTQEYMEIAV